MRKGSGRRKKAMKPGRQKDGGRNLSCAIGMCEHRILSNRYWAHALCNAKVPRSPAPNAPAAQEKTGKIVLRIVENSREHTGLALHSFHGSNIFSNIRSKCTCRTPSWGPRGPRGPLYTLFEKRRLCSTTCGPSGSFLLFSSGQVWVGVRVRDELGNGSKLPTRHASASGRMKQSQVGAPKKKEITCARHTDTTDGGRGGTAHSTIYHNPAEVDVATSVFCAR